MRLKGDAIDALLGFMAIDGLKKYKAFREDFDFVKTYTEEMRLGLATGMPQASSGCEA